MLVGGLAVVCSASSEAASTPPSGQRRSLHASPSPSPSPAPSLWEEVSFSYSWSFNGGSPDEPATDDNLVPVPSTAPIYQPTVFVPDQVSASTCSDLGWTNAALFGDTSVCGESHNSAGACSGLLSWRDGAAFCERAGARLCTITEITTDETRGTGCGLDAVKVWSSTACARGYQVAVSGGSASCNKVGTLTSTRCCADEVARPTSTPVRNPTAEPKPAPSTRPTGHPLPAPTSVPAPRPSQQPSAQPMPVPSPQPTMHPSSQPTVHPIPRPTPSPTMKPSARPTIRPTQQPTPDPTLAPFPQPTMHPIPIPTHSPVPVPTSFPTPTPNPSSRPVLNPTGRPTLDPTPYSPALVSASTCLDLGWTNAAIYGSTSVCGETDDNLGGCSGWMTWREATSFCEDAGARLCTLEELEARETRSTGCSYDKDLSWSSTSCPGNGYSLASSAATGAAPSCSPTESTVGRGRCCADMVLPTSAPVPVPTAERTPTPSAWPTSSNAVSASVFLTITASAAPSESDKASLKETIASSAGVAEQDIKNFAVTYSSARRYHLRRLLATVTWTISFDVVVSLASTTSTNSADFAASVGASLADPSFAAALGSALSTPVTVDTVLSSVRTREPTMEPSDAAVPAPTPLPSQMPSVSVVVSASSCDDLGWTNAALYGSSSVCGESDLNLGGCSGLLTWQAAVSFCESAGARLCTLEEIVNKETKSTGCGVDQVVSWSSSACAGGYSLAASFGSESPTCDASSSAHPTRCCADVVAGPPVAEPSSRPVVAPTPAPATADSPVPQPTAALVPAAVSASSCDDLGWTNAALYGSSSVCGESDNSLGGCSGLLTWQAAVSFCESAGARLCTLEEIVNKETRSTGCGIDKDLCWSSSACAGGYSLAVSLGTEPPACDAPSSMHHARCCADVSS